VVLSLGGLTGLGLHVPAIRDLVRSRWWQPVPAGIEGVWLPTHRGDEGGISRLVTARYRYEYGGKSYTGKCVSPEMFKSSWKGHLQRHRELTRHKKSGKPFTAWVNPENPSESLLYRSVSPQFWLWPSVSLVATLVGWLAVAGGHAMRRAQRWRRESMDRDPKHPWRADIRWARGFRIKTGPEQTVAASWGCALFSLVLFGPWIVIFSLTPSATIVRIIAGVVALIPLITLYAAVRSTIPRLSYRPPELELSEMPVVPGRPTICTVFCGREVEGEKGFKVHIHCKRTVTRDGRIVSNDVYEDRREVERDFSGHDPGTVVPVDVLLPEDVPVLSPDEGGGKIEWFLELTAVSSKSVFHARFDLPVYHVEDESLIEQRPPGGG
jgi:hypothetical protein